MSRRGKRRQGSFEVPYTTVGKLPRLFDSDDDQLVVMASRNAEATATASGPPPTTTSGNPSRPPPPPRAGGDASTAGTDRPATSADIALIMKSIEALTGKFGEVKSGISALEGKFDSQERKVDDFIQKSATERADMAGMIRGVDERVDDLTALVEDGRDALPSTIRSVVDERLAEVGLDSSVSGNAQKRQLSSGLSVDKEAVYIKYRKSLHVWPLKDATTTGLADFATTYLKMSQEEFGSFGVCVVRQCRTKISGEIVVEFDTIAERDGFRSYAPRLASYNRSVGMRLAVPDYLMSTFKVLENEGFKIVQRMPRTKRSIKFEDVSRSLVMDVKLPGKTWVRVTPEQVSKATRRRKQDVVAGVEDVLAIGGMDLPEGTQGNAPLVDTDDGMEESAGNEQNE